MIMRIPFGYERMFEIIKRLQSESDIVDILEHGCLAGHFTRFLRDNGFNAVGIDIDEKSFLEDYVQKGYLINLASGAIGKYFGDKQFDLILANRLFSLESTRVLVAERYARGNLTIFPETDVLDVAKYNTETILEASLKQLKPGKFFISTIDGDERPTATREMVERIGYKIIQFEPYEMILKT